MAQMIYNLCKFALPVFNNIVHDNIEHNNGPALEIYAKCQVTANICTIHQPTTKSMDPFYKIAHYKSVSDIRRFKSGFHKCCFQRKCILVIYKKDHLNKMNRLDRKITIYLWSFFYIIYTFLFGYNLVV